MSLLVLDPTTDRSILLTENLSGLGYEVLSVKDPGLVVELAAQGSVQAVLCLDLELIEQCAPLPPGTVLALVTEQTLNPTQLTQAMRMEVVDVWPLGSSVEKLQNHMDSLLHRAALRLSGIDAQVAAMRAELEQDQRAGQYLQEGMLPENQLVIGDYQFQHRVQPSLILCGDFVDYFALTQDHIVCYMADVSGHGASSAFVTVLLRDFSRRLQRDYQPSMLKAPGEVLSWINHELLDHGIDKHVAMFFGVIDVPGQEIHYANAAHLPPAIMVIDGVATPLEQRAKPLGLFDGAQFESDRFSFPSGARLVVFSDGVLDLVSAPTLKEKEQALAQAIVDCSDMEHLWNGLDLENLGLDDVSCLMVEHQS